EPLDFQDSNWESHLRNFVLLSGSRQLPDAVDYFLFSRHLYRDLPPFVVGRVYWDHWLVWKARSTSVPVIDASADVLAIHQNHDYGYHARGLQGVKTDSESRLN